MKLFPEVAHLFVNPVLDNVCIDLDVKETMRTSGQNGRAQRHLEKRHHQLNRAGDATARRMQKQIETIRRTIEELSSRTKSITTVDGDHDARRRSSDLSSSPFSEPSKGWTKIPTHTLKVQPGVVDKTPHRRRAQPKGHSVKSKLLPPMSRSYSIPPMPSPLRLSDSLSSQAMKPQPHRIPGITYTHAQTDAHAHTDNGMYLNTPSIYTYPRQTPLLDTRVNTPVYYHQHSQQPSLSLSHPQSNQSYTLIPALTVNQGPTSMLHVNENNRTLLPVTCDNDPDFISKRDLAEISSIPGALSRRRTIRRGDVLHESLKTRYTLRQERESGSDYRKNDTTKRKSTLSLIHLDKT